MRRTGNRKIAFTRDITPDNRRRARQKDVGRDADDPAGIPPHGWWDVLWRWFHRLADDRVDLIAAGVSFYLLLALFPAIAAFVSLFGVYLQGAPLSDVFSFLETVLPNAMVSLISGQLGQLIGQSRDVLSVGFITALVITFWIANRGIMALFEAMNVAFDEREERGYIRLYLTGFAFTLGAMFVAAVFIAGVGVVPAIFALVGADGWMQPLVRQLRWPVLFATAMAGIMMLYRFGPSRRHARLRWIAGGAGLATLVWLAASMGFSWYLQNFANYNATYGSLGAVAIFMTWAWLSVFILIAGAELSAEMEYRTAVDSATGGPEPLRDDEGPPVGNSAGRP